MLKPTLSDCAVSSWYKITTPVLLYLSNNSLGCPRSNVSIQTAKQSKFQLWPFVYNVNVIIHMRTIFSKLKIAATLKPGDAYIRRRTRSQLFVHAMVCHLFRNLDQCWPTTPLRTKSDLSKRKKVLQETAFAMSFAECWQFCFAINALHLGKYPFCEIIYLHRHTFTVEWYLLWFNWRISPGIAEARWFHIQLL